MSRIYQKTLKHYRTIFETTGAATIILEKDATISLVNKEFERVTGEEKGAIVGKKWTELLCHPERERMSRYHQVRRQDPASAPPRYETHFFDKWGKKREILVSVSMIPETSKSVVSFLDITDQKQAEEAAKTLAREKEIFAEISRIVSSTLEIEEVYEKFAEEVRKLIPFDRLAVHVLRPETQSTLVAHIAGPPVVERTKGSLIPLAGSFNEAVIQSGASLILQGGEEEIAARSGGEAVEKYKAHREKIDLIVLDMIMPGMGGGAVYDRLKEINPEVKVILASGYSLDGEASQILEKGCKGFIQKPFGIQELSQKIRKILDA